MGHGYPLASAVLGCLLAGGAAADDGAPPDEALLEFLGSWSGQDADADWFDFLESLPGPPAGPADAPGPGPRDDDDEAT